VTDQVKAHGIIARAYWTLERLLASASQEIIAVSAAPQTPEVSSRVSVSSHALSFPYLPRLLPSQSGPSQLRVHPVPATTHTADAS